MNNIMSNSDLCAISANELSRWGQTCLQALDVPAEDARFVAESLVQTSLWGIDSHGIARLPHYLNRLQGGSLEPKPAMEMTRTGPCSGDLDGGHGLGIVVMGRATGEAIAMAQENGVGFVGVRESSHCGAIGLYGRMIAQAGLIGMVFTHSDAFVAPHRGFQKFLGTNPVCISMPCKDGRPLCLDMATSAVAWNAVMNARRENRPVRGDIAYNEEGHPVTDPHKVACLRPMAEHKGYALAMMIELLCGPLNGMPWGPNIPAMYGDRSERRHLGSFVGALDPARFFGGANFPATVAALASTARSQPVRDQAEPVLVPGDDHYANEQKRRALGIPIEPGLAEEIKLWSSRLGVSDPLISIESKS